MEDLYSSSEVCQLLKEISRFRKAKEKRKITAQGLIIWASQNFDESICAAVKKLVA